MIVNRISQQIYPESFPSNKTKNPPFKKSSKYPKEFITSLKDEIKPHIVYYATKVIKLILYVIFGLFYCIIGNKIFYSIIFISSLLSNLAHLGFQLFLIYYYCNEYGMRLFITISIIALIFFANEFAIIFMLCKKNDELIFSVCIYILVFFIYFGMFISTICYMDKSEKTYTIISSVLFCLTINFPGISLIVLAIAYSNGLISFLLEMILRKLIMLSKKEEDPNMFEY